MNNIKQLFKEAEHGETTKKKKAKNDIEIIL